MINPYIIIAAFVVSACSTLATPEPTAHIGTDNFPNAPAESVVEPAPIADPIPPVTKPAAKVETYNVVVNNIKAQDLLFALARDAKVNVDVYPGITGTVTLNAVEQTLPEILTRLSSQIDIRWELKGKTLAVMPDTPYLKSYVVDYVNMSRDTTGSVTVTTQIASTGGITGGTAGGNNSLTKIDNTATNHFWGTLEKNIKDLLRETDKIVGNADEVVIPKVSPIKGQTPTPQPTTDTSKPSTQFREAASVIVNTESGVISVRATSRQHERVEEFITQVTARASRQVLIEATVAEVQLNDSFQQGVDWSAAPLGAKGFTIKQGATGSLSAPGASILQLGYNNATSKFGNISSLVQLLESFGTVKVLSSPKLSVLNNQSAVLKVVDNQVYFTIKADTTATANVGSTTTFTTDLHSVPIGFVMNVTPQISNTQTVILNIRPSVSRIVDYVSDPNPSLKATKANGFDQDIVSRIPIIRTREMDSVLRIENGNIAVMGGLMEDSINNKDDNVPGISNIPLFGNLFKNTTKTRTKTELIIFLRPIVINSAADYKKIPPPGKDYFKE
jgi:general secretion pathway protein D